MSDFPGNVQWDSDQGLDAAEAMNGRHLLLGRPVVQDESSPNFLAPVAGRLLVVPPTKHLLTIGPTRSGKGVSQVIPNLLTYAGPAVVVDVRGESTWATAQRRREGGEKVVIVDPFGEVNLRYGARAGVTEPVARFNPLAVLEPGSKDYQDDVENLAGALIVNQGGDPYWDDSARELVGGLIALAVEAPEFRREASLGFVRALLCLPEDGLRGAAARAAELDGASLAARKLMGFQTGGAEVASVIATARTQTAFLDSEDLVESLAESDFSFDELLSANGTVYLVLPPDKVETYGRWLRLMVSTAIHAVVRGRVDASGRLSALFMLDDFCALGNVDAVERAFGLVSGLGVTVWAFAQSLSDLKYVYPKNWETLLANSQVVSALGVGDRETEEYISKVAGVAPNGGGGLAEEIRLRRPELCVVVRPGGPLLCRRIEYFRDPEFAGAARLDAAFSASEPEGPVRTDVIGEESGTRETGEQALDELIGLESVKQGIREYRDLLHAARARGRDPREVLQPYFVITGNTGSGKSSVARVLGEIFSEVGYLQSDKVVEVDRSQLAGAFIGQSEARTREVLEGALGGILLIDDPYGSVVRGAADEDYGGEVIDTLLAFMEENRGRLAVIAAGFEKQMAEFLASNPGLRSRFTNFLRLPDYTAEESALMFVRMAQKAGFKIDPGLNAELSKLLADLISAPGWSNGRDVRALLELVLGAQVRRVTERESSEADVLDLADVSEALQSMLERKSSGRHA